jgi:7-cyano-7-deazaguanine synthase
MNRIRANKKAVVLLSGGLDSSTTIYIAKREFDVYALTFSYGQRHSLEIECARKVAAIVGASEHQICNIDLRTFGGSGLTGSMPVPKNNPVEEMDEGIPVTYVPARNTIFLSFALAWAEVLRSTDIFIGVNAVDYSGYPDCRPEYIDAYQNMANLATKSGIEGNPVVIHTPLINSTKAEIISLGANLGVDYSLTMSCYDPTFSGEACGNCDSCQLRLKGFKDAGLTDEARYQNQEATFRV